MTAHLLHHLAEARTPLARALVTIALPIAVLAGSSDAGAMSLVATHAPGGAVHIAIVQADTSQIFAVSRSVGLMEGAPN